MLNLSSPLFQYHFKKDGKTVVEDVSFFAIEKGYIKKKEEDGWTVEARYFSPLAFRFDTY